ncbi:hypothetical protein TNCV_1301971 [Trichonephila clavipes]|nr:hypothetical protein TNCV_1301971 [Trichonephila clavipes]
METLDNYCEHKVKNPLTQKLKMLRLINDICIAKGLHLIVAIVLPDVDAGSFAIQEKGGNCLVPGLDYMLDALKLPKQAPGISGRVWPGVVLMELHTSSVGQFWSIASFKRSSS